MHSVNDLLLQTFYASPLTGFNRSRMHFLFIFPCVVFWECIVHHCTKSSTPGHWIHEKNKYIKMNRASRDVVWAWTCSIGDITAHSTSQLAAHHSLPVEIRWDIAALWRQILNGHGGAKEVWGTVVRDSINRHYDYSGLLWERGCCLYSLPAPSLYHVIHRHSVSSCLLVLWPFPPMHNARTRWLNTW